LLESKVAARLVYAVGNPDSPEQLEALAKIKNPIALAMEIGRLEGQLTTKKTPKATPALDRPMGGGGGGAADSTLERLEAEAEKTGNRSKIVAYKMQKRQAK